ncbi:hypothetical protein OPT61_g8828 [Boeremia exigua]|uniref:Uncharacterized protein n=1 Tax=Boeremia exigua TaxID=749465 RepID=A0ACC2HWL4_9PLEO|nr:hypothetical protein OPT61_g8828 [Boeremia exigua]
MNEKRPHAGNGIRISIYCAKSRENKKWDTHTNSSVLWLAITLLQIGIAAIPLVRHRDWGVFLVTGSGILASILAGALPQWRIEKTPLRQRSYKYIALTSGNGSRDIMVIYGAGEAFDLEELAAAESPRCDRLWETIKMFSHPVLDEFKQPQKHRDGSEMRVTRMFHGLPRGLWLTRIASFFQVVFWLALLITVAGLESHSWYLVAVGSIGMMQNAMLAAAPRRPERRGLPLTLVDTIATKKVMDGLMDLEATIYGAGQVLRDEFFPGCLHEDEVRWWSGIAVKPVNLKLMDDYDHRRLLDERTRGTPRSRLQRRRDLDIPDIDFSAKRWLNRRSSTNVTANIEMDAYEYTPLTQPERANIEPRPSSRRDAFQPPRPYRDIKANTQAPARSPIQSPVRSPVRSPPWT